MSINRKAYDKYAEKVTDEMLEKYGPRHLEKFCQVVKATVNNAELQHDLREVCKSKKRMRKCYWNGIEALSTTFEMCLQDYCPDYQKTEERLWNELLKEKCIIPKRTKKRKLKLMIQMKTLWYFEHLQTNMMILKNNFEVRQQKEQEAQKALADKFLKGEEVK